MGSKMGRPANFESGDKHLRGQVRIHIILSISGRQSQLGFFSSCAGCGEIKNVSYQVNVVCMDLFNANVLWTRVISARNALWIPDGKANNKCPWNVQMAMEQNRRRQQSSGIHTAKWEMNGCSPASALIHFGSWFSSTLRALGTNPYPFGINNKWKRLFPRNIIHCAQNRWNSRGVRISNRFRVSHLLHTNPMICMLGMGLLSGRTLVHYVSKHKSKALITFRQLSLIFITHIHTYTHTRAYGDFVNKKNGAWIVNERFLAS